MAKTTKRKKRPQLSTPRTSDVRVQVDRWPIEHGGEYVLTAIVVCTFKEKPNARAMSDALMDAGALALDAEG